MSAEEMLAALLAKLSGPAPLPVAVALWDTSDIGAYLKRSTSNVRQVIVCLPSFPAPIRLPIDGRSQALYKAREVVKWAESH
jgi:hypothetical protein